MEQSRGELTVAEWPFSAASDEVVLAIEACGLCGSDLHLYRGESPTASFPILFGHEYAARVERHPKGATDVLGRPLHEGDQVVAASPGFDECGRCFSCVELGAAWQCPYRNVRTFDVDGRLVTVSGGGLARYLPLSAARSRLLLRTDVPPLVASLHEPMTIAVQMVLRGPAVLGSDVVVQGSGAIGLMTVLAARAAGAACVVVVGGPPARLALARDFGADLTIDIAEIDDPAERVARVRSVTTAGVGAAVAYEIAGSPEAVTEGLRYLRPGGHLMEAGNAAATGTVELDPNLDLQGARCHLVGVRGRELRDFLVAGRLVERFSPQLSRLVSHRIPLSRTLDGLLALDGSYRLDGADVVKIVVEPDVG